MCVIKNYSNMRRNDWKPRFRVTFRFDLINGHYDIDSMYFLATSESAARRQAHRYLKSLYGCAYKILSII